MKETSEKKNGLLCVISSPSGGGKTSVIKTVLHNNPDYKYYITVVDIFGNETEPIECPAMIYSQVDGRQESKQALRLEHKKKKTRSFCNVKVTVDKKTPKKIGVIKHHMKIDLQTSLQ